MGRTPSLRQCAKSSILAPRRRSPSPSWGFPGELTISEAAVLHGAHYLHKSAKVAVLVPAFVEREGLLVQVAEEVERGAMKTYVPLILRLRRHQKFSRPFV